MPEQLIHLHIPKTAGTSLRRALVDTYGPNNVYHYDPEGGGFVRSNLRLTASERSLIDHIKSNVYARRTFRVVKPLFRIVRAGEKALTASPENVVAHDFKALSGHFTGNDLLRWNVPQAPTVTTVRDPLERVWSQYRHWLRSEGLAFSRPEAPFDPATRFEDYAMQPHLANYQHRRIGSWPIQFAATTDSLPQLIEGLGLTPDGTPRLNVGQSLEMPLLDRGFVRDFEEANTKDYELFAVSQEGRTVSVNS